MKDRIIRDIKILFEKEDYYYKLIRISNIGTISNMKVVVIEIKTYQ